MIDYTDIKVARAHGCRALDLSVTTQAQIRIGIDEQLGIDRTVGLVTRGAALPQSGMFENERMRLFPVTLGASFVQARHGQAALGLSNIAAVRIVTLNAVHPVLRHRMVPRQTELGVNIQVASKTTCRVLAWIGDKNAPSAASLHMFAARPVAGFATGPTCKFGVLKANSRVDAAGKLMRNRPVAVRANFVAHEGGARYFRGLEGVAWRKAGGKKEGRRCQREQHRRRHRAAPEFFRGLPVHAFGQYGLRAVRGLTLGVYSRNSRRIACHAANAIQCVF